MAEDRITKIDLGITKRDFGGRELRAVLHLTTGKSYRKDIRSEAQMGWNGLHCREVAMGLGAPGGDYSRECARVSGPATQKKIDALHAATFTPELTAEITEQAKAWSQRMVDREEEQRAKFNADVAAIA